MSVRIVVVAVVVVVVDPLGIAEIVVIDSRTVTVETTETATTMEVVHRIRTHPPGSRIYTTGFPPR